MKIGRFIVDTHVHSQRHAAGKALKGSKDFGDLGRAMGGVEAYDNSPRLIYDMDCYGVDMCVIEPAFGMTNENNLDQVARFPDRFVANCLPWATKARFEGGIADFTFDAACEELEKLLKTGKFVGIGEGMPMGGMRRMSPGEPPELPDENTMLKNMFKVCDIARKYKVPIRYHTGTPGGYTIPYHGARGTFNPLWGHTIAAAYPDVPLILEHGGIEGGWWESFFEQCLHVAASNKNVYLETGRYWTELYYKALEDPNVGAEKLIWGTDWGASLPLYTNLNGRHQPPVYTRQLLKQGIPRHQVDIWGWSLKQIDKLDIAQDDINLITGGNAVRIYNLRTPGGLTRMFKFVD